jgi:hypothetical protein
MSAIDTALDRRENSDAKNQLHPTTSHSRRDSRARCFFVDTTPILQILQVLNQFKLFSTRSAGVMGPPDPGLGHLVEGIWWVSGFLVSEFRFLALHGARHKVCPKRFGPKRFG